MKHSNISIKHLDATLADNANFNNHYHGVYFDRIAAIILIAIFAPIFLLNTLIALFTNKKVFILHRKVDALGREVVLHEFTQGLFKKSAILFDLLANKIGLCGVPLTHTVSPDIRFSTIKQITVKAGIFSLYDLHLKTGLSVANKEALLEKQLNGSLSDYLSLMVKSTLCTLLYGLNNEKLNNAKTIHLFSLKIKNTTMNEAVDWIVNHPSEVSETQLGFFVNVHSINLSINNNNFSKQLAKADALFADGSGMRIAATKAGYLLNGNNNGTDMLPHLCKEAIRKNKSLYLLGAKPGIAEMAAKNLKKSHKGLNIAGTENGYTDLNNDALINQINASGCDLLLVAMGSPTQEKWLLDNKHKLHCKTALAVGGLFDFYSGSISRSPLWLRELGMEWVWRLIQEPRNKFTRYVIGTPLFLYRTFILNLVHKGV